MPSDLIHSVEIKNRFFSHQKKPVKLDYSVIFRTEMRHTVEIAEIYSHYSHY